MTTHEFITETTTFLTRQDISTARLDCLVLLEDILNTNRTHILAYPDEPLTEEHLNTLRGNVTRRANHEPLAYIRGHAEFYGRSYLVNTHVLIPRPESEALIDLLKDTLADTSTTIIDVGTGSGALAVTARLLFSHNKVIATDIDNSCIDVARKNADRHHASIDFLHGPLLDPLPQIILSQPTIFLCNLPYVPIGFPINADATHEPAKALFAGRDGLKVYRQLFRQFAKRIQPLSTTRHIILTEALPSQHTRLTRIAAQHNFVLKDTHGLAQRFDYST